MSNSKKASQNSSAGQHAGKLSEDQIKANFAEMHPALTVSQAYIEACRCYFCYDAPCTTACPTGIDIPEFIKRIQTGNTKGSARKTLWAGCVPGFVRLKCSVKKPVCAIPMKANRSQ